MMIVFYVMHGLVFLYGGYQLLSLANELTSNASITLAGLVIVPAAILSILRMSLGRILLALFAMFGIIWVVYCLVVGLFSSSETPWHMLGDVIIFLVAWNFFKPNSPWSPLYTRWGVFSKPSSRTVDIGRNFMEQIEESESEVDPVQLRFSNYCHAYLVEVRNLSGEQASLLLLDPELGREIDKAKMKWLINDIGMGNDVDMYLDPPGFNALQMESINAILAKFAREYPEREQKIMTYLESIGYFDDQ